MAEAAASRNELRATLASSLHSFRHQPRCFGHPWRNSRRQHHSSRRWPRCTLLALLMPMSLFHERIRSRDGGPSIGAILRTNPAGGDPILANNKAVADGR